MNIIIRLTYILILIATVSTLQAQFSACTDTYGGAAHLRSAQASLRGLSDCYGDNHYACNAIFRSLYEADFDVTSAINDATVGDCTNCNVAAFAGLGNGIQNAYNQLYALGWPQYYSNIPELVRSWSDPIYRCDQIRHHPLDGPNLVGIWESAPLNGQVGKIEITMDRVREHYSIKITYDGTEYLATLVYTGENEIFLKEGNLYGQVYDGAILWEKDTWTKKSVLPTPHIDYTKKGIYIIKISGSGYGRQSSYTKVRGDHIWKYYHNDNRDVRELFREWQNQAKESSYRTCNEGKGEFWSNPLSRPKHPMIWMDGPHYEILEYFEKETPEINDKYVCKENYVRFLCYNWIHDPITRDQLPCKK